MLKAVLVDDEILEREGIRSLIPWDELGIELAGEASGATKALEVAAEISPDILLTDIKMPGKNGIELAQKMKTFLPDIGVIFISGYQDFVYAQRAIALNAYGYVLKPVDKLELTEALKKTIRHIESKNRNDTEKLEMTRRLEESLPVLREQFLRGLLYGGQDCDEAQLCEQGARLGLMFGAGPFRVAVIGRDAACAADGSSRGTPDMARSISGVLEAPGRRGFMMAPVPLKENRYALIMSDHADSCAGGPAPEELLGELIRGLALECGGTFSAGLSERDPSLGSLKRLLAQAEEALGHKWHRGRGSVISAPVAGQEGDAFPAGEKTRLPDFQREMCRDINAGEYDRIESTVRRYLDALPPRDKQDPQSVRNHCLDLIGVMERILSERGHSLGSIFKNRITLVDELLLIDTLEETRSWMTERFAEIARYLAGKRGEQSQLVVARIIDVIERNYSQDLTVEQFAKEVFLSPNYIRKIFKKEMGKTILEYITETRMNKATQLMRTSFLNATEIARKVGYDNPSYFGYIFKQMYGVTPGEYERSMEKTK